MQINLDFKKAPFAPGTQNYRLLERLRLGPIMNHEIVYDLGILKYTNRISDLRARGYDIQSKPIKRGVWQYSLIRGNREKIKSI